MLAAPHDLALIQHKELVASAGGAHAVGMDGGDQSKTVSYNRGVPNIQGKNDLTP